MKFITDFNKPSCLMLPCLLGGMIGGFFGSGGGIILLFILKKYFGEKKEIFPTVIMLTLLSSAVSSVFYSEQKAQVPSPAYIISGILGAVCGCILFGRIRFKALSIAFAALSTVCGGIMIFKAGF